MRITNICVLGVMILSPSLYAQIPIDTLQAEMEDIVVVGYEGNRSLLETPGSISYVRPSTVEGFDNSSLVYGLNTVPGVRMDERSTGSYRISIRGSSLRSPFGIRNVKVYWNGFPITEPSGSTFLNLLSNENMSDVEVIKGPSGSIYGAGNGGVLLINSTSPFFSSYVSSGFSTGSYGALRYNLDYLVKKLNSSFSFKYAEDHSDGYREQSFLKRRVLEISGKAKFDIPGQFLGSILLSDLSYGIPGGLTLDQFNNDPTQARPPSSVALGSVEADAGIDHQALLFGFGYENTFGNDVSFKAIVFGNFSDFENPFNFDYKVDARQSGGLRVLSDTPIRSSPLQDRLTIGYELQTSTYLSKNFGNNYGDPDTLNFKDELEARAQLLFVNYQADLKNDWFLTAGLSLNIINYEIHRLETHQPGDTASDVSKKFNPQLIPRVGVAKKLSSFITAHGSISFGFSPPTIEEIRTNEGSINLDLEPEKGINYEIGVRGNVFDGHIGFDGTLFFYKLRESIVQQQSSRGTLLFRNAGSTNQLGVELGSYFRIINSYEGLLRRLQVNASYTYNHFRFNDYETSSGDYSGNELTGVSPHILVSSLNLVTGPGLYAMFSYNYTDKAPLKDDNSVYSDSYQLVQTKIGWRNSFLDRWSADVYFGIDNLLDEQYSLGYDINAFRGRYYQPAPERNWFAGIRVHYSIKN